MRRVLTVMVVPMFVLGCEASHRRPEISRAPSRVAQGMAAPARRPSGPLPRPEIRRTALSASASTRQGAAASRAPSPPRPTASPTGIEISAAERQVAAAEKQVFEGFSGLVVQETMTKIGNDFFELFCLLWEPPTTGLTGYNVIISEKASPLWGAWITVSVDDAAVWNKMLRPRSEEIEPEIEEARATVYEYISNYEQYQMQSEDMTGTGY